MPGQSFQEIFGFEPKKGDVWVIECALVTTKLENLAKKYFENEVELYGITAVYADPKAVDEEQALSDLNKAHTLSIEKKGLCDAWFEAFEMAKGSGYPTRECLNDYKQ